MDAQIGFVDSIDGELAYVSFATKRECERCGACSSDAQKRAQRLLARNDAGAGVGDRVRVESSNKAMLAISFVVFALPICAAFAGLGAGALVAAATGANKAALSGILAAVFFLAAIGFAIAYDRRARRTASTVLRIVGVIAQEAALEGLPC